MCPDYFVTDVPDRSLQLRLKGDTEQTNGTGYNCNQDWNEYVP